MIATSDVLLNCPFRAVNKIIVPIYSRGVAQGWNNLSFQDGMNHKAIYTIIIDYQTNTSYYNWIGLLRWKGSKIFGNVSALHY